MVLSIIGTGTKLAFVNLPDLPHRYRIMLTEGGVGWVAARVTHLSRLANLQVQIYWIEPPDIINNTLSPSSDSGVAIFTEPQGI